jgi:tetratricopeptide (TPR) repeat protein/tRNA A-37 threonylcarbamoyl transferase component Bud32
MANEDPTLRSGEAAAPVAGQPSLESTLVAVASLESTPLRIEERPASLESTLIQIEERPAVAVGVQASLESTLIRIEERPAADQASLESTLLRIGEQASLEATRVGKQAQPRATPVASLHTTAGGLDETRVSTGIAMPTVSPGLQRGSSVGRYVVLGELGAGGMGVVYAAYDPELDRKVAVKLLRPELGARARPQAAEHARIRLLREAQALAKLGHPNVVAIHDVGTVADGVWLAMEFVEGETLGAWVARGRHWREVLEVMRAAARGLAAAHSAGLIHRDFKPDNVMVSSDGRVRVMDLGLARRGSEPEALTRSSAAFSDDSLLLGQSALKIDLTHVGAVMGTPAYMAPEQHSGGEVGPAADVFAFCVTFWEGLYGERPFAGETYAELEQNVTRGIMRAPPRDRTVPRWLRRTIERGLAVDPAQRWPGIQSLLAELDRGQARVRSTIVGVTLALVVATVGGGWAWQTAKAAAAVASCEAAGASIDEIWNDEARARVRAGLLATGLGHAATTADKVMPWLDRQAAAWREARTGACIDAEIRGTWDAATGERGLQCLEERRLVLASLVTTLAQAGPEVAKRAVSTAASLEPVGPCRDREQMARTPALPVEVAARVQVAREAIVQVGDFQTAGRIDEGIAAARAALVTAEEVGWPPIVAAARLKLGTLLLDRGDFAGAEAAMVAAYFMAVEVDALGVAADAGLALTYVIGRTLGRHEEGKRWSRHAEMAIRPLEPVPGLRSARRLNHLAGILNATAAYAEAAELHASALAIQESLLGRAHPELIGTLNAIADIRMTMGDKTGAGQILERALGIAEEALGAEHPDLAVSLQSLAKLRSALGAREEALALSERALVILEKTYGPDNVNAAGVLILISGLHRLLGDQERAQATSERALKILEVALGPENPKVAAALATLASNRQSAGAFAEAKALNLRALKIFEKALGPEHPDVAKSLKNLANAHKHLREFAEAKPLLERALAIREKVLGPEHPVVALTLIDVGSVNLDLGDPAAAQAPYARALKIAELLTPPDDSLVASALVGLANIAAAQRRPDEVAPLAARVEDLLARGTLSPIERGYVTLKLAKALWAADPAHRKQARALVEAARDALRPLHGGSSDLKDVEEWLSAHPLK